mmetsp:Transcript_9685/g.23928  ORF Transcript_9685/g.23928 Transcript_9685/m.23928 type:complete len:209 (+) Transcript_9685:61-687(+)
MKYSSDRATRSSSMARSSSGSSILRWPSSLWHMSRISLARGSVVLYRRCPNPMSRKGSALSFAFATHAGMFSTDPISSSICSTASLAPPCAGPHRDATPAAMHAKGFAWDDPAMRTVDVLAFCSWSACSISITSKQRAATGSSAYGLVGRANIMYRKFSAKLRSSRGYTMGCPCAVLYAMAARVVIFPKTRMAALSLCAWSRMSIPSL